MGKITFILFIVFVVWTIHRIFGWKHVWNNLRKRGTTDYNKKNFKVIQDLISIRRDGLNLKEDQIVPYAEQLLHRKLECRLCWESGSCVKCDCDAKGMMITPNAICKDKEDPKWHEMELDPVKLK